MKTYETVEIYLHIFLTSASHRLCAPTSYARRKCFSALMDGTRRDINFVFQSLAAMYSMLIVLQLLEAQGDDKSVKTHTNLTYGVTKLIKWVLCSVC
jgi:hypothetical protein